MNTIPRENNTDAGNSKKAGALSLMVFIDALGWEVLRDRKFMQEELPHRRKLRSVFGFSSACVPSILTGKTPRDHGHWSYFYYSPQSSPFGLLKLLRLLPKKLTDRGRVRHLISRLLGKLFGFTGYFQIYNLPFSHAGLFDYCEKNDIFKPGGMNKGDNIFDVLENNNVNYHVSDWRKSEEENLKSCHDAITAADARFAFLYMASMDSLLHQVGKHSPKVDTKLAWYEQQLHDLLAHAREHYDEVRLFVCSDHGMATVEQDIDLMTSIESLPLTYGEDYVAVYDSTMARFWFHNHKARNLIRETLSAQEDGHILGDKELAQLGCDFEGKQFGEMIYLLDPGKIIVPSHMGLKTITGMHGYHPDHPDSDAALLANVETELPVNSLTDLFDLMSYEAGVMTDISLEKACA
jgi:predicted AlkP superfamily pyrophosphatase or phosphodiesterase